MQIIDGSKTKLIKTIQADGSVDIVYTEEDGSPLLALEIKSRRAKAQSDYQLIIKDLELVVSSLLTAQQLAEELVAKADKDFIQHDHNNQNHVIVWGLFTSSIITYGKCYADSKARHVKIPQSKLNACLGEELKNTHKKIIEYRNQWIAHGGINKNEISKTILLLDPQRQKIPSVTYHTSFNPWGSLQEIYDFLDLAIAVLEFMREYIVTKGAEFFHDKIDNGNHLEFYKDAKPSINFKAE